MRIVLDDVPIPLVVVCCFEPFADLAFLCSRLHDGRCLCREYRRVACLSIACSQLSRVQAVAKTSAAPIERIKLLVQNQDEMVSSLPLSAYVCVP